MFYSANPNAITASAVPGGFAANRLIIPLQDGGKSAIRLADVESDDPVVVIPLQDGGKAVKKLTPLSVGDVVTVVQLQGGSKVAVNNDEYIGPSWANKVIISARNCTATRIYVTPGQPFKLRLTLRKFAPSISTRKIQVVCSHSATPPVYSTRHLYMGDVSYDWQLYETREAIATASTYLGTIMIVEEGAYIQISKVEYSLNSGITWLPFTPDGSFTLGDWSPSCTYPGWVRTDIGFYAQYGSGYIESCDL
jgi:hypothetical protein